MALLGGPSPCQIWLPALPLVMRQYSPQVALLESDDPIAEG